MNGSNDNIVVYHSQADRAIDLWMWNGGWIVVLVAILSVLLAALLLKYMDYRRTGYWD